jgi:lipopolysaccharide/colanic/teichoic acid biosynthesis glycosyltransferase
MIRELCGDVVPENLLLEQLYRRYAKGGRRFVILRSFCYFLFKKYSWKLVIGSTLFLKRCFDIILSVILIFILSPIFLLTALLIKLEDRGPVIYCQQRVGIKGKRFTIYKFRSMITNAERVRDELNDLNETQSIIFKIRKDPRLTRTGRIIRKFSIDELPQLFNILKGDMSIVGPRPPLPSEVSKYRLRDLKRLDVTPGLTCFWQVSGRSNINFDGQVDLDLQYIESQSIWTDIKLLFKTIPAVLTGRGAY